MVLGIMNPNNNIEVIQRKVMRDVGIRDIGILCWKVFVEISVTELKQKLLRCDHQKDVFKKIVNISFYDTCAMLPWSLLQYAATDMT